jgi:hypothetical protein
MHSRACIGFYYLLTSFFSSFIIFAPPFSSYKIHNLLVTCVQLLISGLYLFMACLYLFIACLALLLYGLFDSSLIHLNSHWLRGCS